MSQSPSTSGFGVAKIGALALAALVVAALGFWMLQPLRSDIARIESEHSIELPPSSRSAQAMGDASNPILRGIGIDRGASSIIVIDRADLPALLDQFPALAEGPPTLGGTVAPGNSIYQPSSVPWSSREAREATFSTSDPPSGGDFADIAVYALDDPDSVGVWIYTDWH